MAQLGLLASIGLLLIAFLSMTSVVFELSGYSFVLSVVLLAGLLVFSALGISGVANNRAWGWSFLSFLSLLFIIYAYFVYMVEGSFGDLTTLIAASITLFVVALLNFRLAYEPKPRKKRRKVEVYQTLEKMEPMASEKPSVAKSFTPGKFVASKYAGTYHMAKCEWANNIKKQNRVWFVTEQEAKKAGMKPHSCLTG